ncbi:MAG: hypothetical protein MUC92_04690 [Fimbriimonadaceae bacterium]|jgi:hypothetical protein|nr:hypothetical protein [Fimbriimonadaceae bacterium]
MSKIKSSLGRQKQTVGATPLIVFGSLSWTSSDPNIASPRLATLCNMAASGGAIVYVLKETVGANSVVSSSDFDYILYPSETLIDVGLAPGEQLRIVASGGSTEVAATYLREVH